MKDFFAKLALFISLICSISIGIVFISDLVVKSKERQNLQISDEIHMVFAGDSNVECAVNDGIIANSINIAQSGEAYLYTYVKIKSLIAYNHNINKIFIGFSDGNLLKETEKRWLFKDEFVMEKIGFYNYLMDYPEKLLIIKHNPKAYLMGLLKSVTNNLKLFIRSFSILKSNKRIENFGGFEYLVRNKLDEEIGMDISNNQYVKPERGFLQVKYLGMISDLCSRHSIALILFNTPKHRYHNENFDEAARRNWISVRNSFSRDSLLDFSNYSLPDSCFGDLTHLNYKGADIFSKYLNNRLNSDVNNSDAIIRLE